MRVLFNENVNFYSEHFDRNQARLLLWIVFLDTYGPPFCLFIQQQFNIPILRTLPIQKPTSATAKTLFDYLGVFN